MKYWFRPARFWKWFAAYYPVSLEGWVVTFWIFGFAALMFLKIDSQSHSASDTLINFSPWALISLLLFDLACFRTGEYPSWWKPRNKK